MSRKRTHHGNRRRGTHPKPHKPHALLTGVIHVVRPGSAYVQTPEGAFSVHRRGVREAMDGDEVQVSLVPMHGRAGERVAYVQGVLQRACSSFVGTYGVADPLGVVSPLDGRLSHDFFVLPEDKSARRLDVREGDVVSARILEYPTRKSAGVATIDRRLGSAAELDVGVEAIVASYGLAGDFGADALAEAEGMKVDAEGALRADRLRRDLRKQPCLTVDPADARDFDDAVYARRAGEGYRVSVHIADVTHYVRWDGACDLEARSRTCSAYLVDRVVPMLPERLCNDVCSLRPDEDRLAMTVEMELDKRGRIVASDAFPSVIRSRARLSYDAVDELLEGTVAAQALPCAEGSRAVVAEALAVLDEVARLRVAIREERGAVDFDTVEPKVVLGEGGVPLRIVVRARTRATGLIEEAMLMANECVAQLLAEHDVATAYRVHERPAPDDLRTCVPVLRELGLVDNIDAERVVAGDPQALREVIDRAEGTSDDFLTNALLLRAQKRAVYAPHNEGHYALGARAYCHFTSPIRRYPDVLVHRALKRMIATGAVEGSRAEEAALPQLCRTCSERERIADAASRASTKLKMAEYYGERVGERFSGVIVGCERYGLFVRLDDTCAEGFLPVRSLGDEWFAYDEDRMRMVGESTGRIWRLGQRVAVEVTGVEPSRGRIDFALAGRR